jgi:predicted GNAT family N-acyltransferase
LNNSITIKSYNQLPEEARSIRIEVFVDEQGFNEEFDKVDYEAIHFLAFNSQGAPVGTCRIFNKDDKSVFYLGRLAVLKSYRGLKIGSALICQCENVARNLGASEIRLHSQYRVKNFYQKCGYNEYGEIEDEEGCPHIWMKKNIGE